MSERRWLVVANRLPMLTAVLDVLLRDHISWHNFARSQPC